MKTEIVKIDKEEYDLMMEQISLYKGIFKMLSAHNTSCRKSSMQTEIYGKTTVVLIDNVCNESDDIIEKFERKKKEIKNRNLKKKKEEEDFEQEDFFDTDDSLLKFNSKEN